MPQRKLTLLATYDDMCRQVNNLIRSSAEEEDYSMRMLESIQKRWQHRELTHEREKQDLKLEIAKLQKEIKKLNRQLGESRTALTREVDEKKVLNKERKSLMDQIRQVRELVESKDGIDNNDAHRRRVIKCLDIDRLSPIQSDDSDDCVSGLDYDRTEEDILDLERSRRSNAFDDAVEQLPSDEQPTLPYRFLEKDTDSAGTATDQDNDIGFVRDQLLRYEQQTMSAKSTASLARQKSTVAPPPTTPSSQKPHTFSRKKSFKPETCGPCGAKMSFYTTAVKCENCGIIAHPECKTKCPLPCVKITVPNSRSRPKLVLISDYVNKDASPKCPALIVHCCNEIEREHNITTEGLYRVVARTSEIEDLQTKILKSKSGMPNLSKIQVHLLTGVVKRFLQSLDESLITTTLWSHLSEAVRVGAPEEARSHMTYYITYDLPTANRDTLAYIMQHLHAIANRSDKNKMSLENLSKTLAPTIVGNSCRKPDQSVIQSETRVQVQIMDALLAIEEEFWEGFVKRSILGSTPTASLGSRLLDTPSSSIGVRTRSSARLGSTLPTPKLKPLFSR